MDEQDQVLKVEPEPWGASHSVSWPKTNMSNLKPWFWGVWGKGAEFIQTQRDGLLIQMKMFYQENRKKGNRIST